ncbi:MAG: hypothetical protein WCE81_03145 [Halobacteriota archaeon]
MVTLIFCQVISGELLALVAALGTAAAVALTFGGSAIGFLGDIVVTGGAGVVLVGATVAAVPAALAILLALGVTIPFKIPL